MGTAEDAAAAAQAAADAEDMAAKSNSNGNGNSGATVVQVVSGSPAGAPGRNIQVSALIIVFTLGIEHPFLGPRSPANRCSS